MKERQAISGMENDQGKKAQWNVQKNQWKDRERKEKRKHYDIRFNLNK